LTICPSKLQQAQTKQRVYLTASLLLLDVCVVLRLVLLVGCRTWRRVRVMLEQLLQPLANRQDERKLESVVSATLRRTLATRR